MEASCCRAAPSWRPSWRRRATKGCARSRASSPARAEPTTGETRTTREGEWPMAKVIEERSAAPALDLERIRKDFPILERTDHGKPLVYLDSAATSQKPRQVIEALTDYYERHNANIHRGVYALAEEATAMYEAARERLARFIGAPDSACVVFNRGTTESINLVAHGYGRKFLREGDEILLSELEHHSNIVPWQFCAEATGATLEFVPLGEDGALDLSTLDRLITKRTKIVAVTGQSNVIGTLPPLPGLADAAHSVGAVLVVGGAQLVPPKPV